MEKNYGILNTEEMAKKLAGKDPSNSQLSHMVLILLKSHVNMDKKIEKASSCFTVVPLINFLVEKRNKLWHKITSWLQGFSAQ